METVYEPMDKILAKIAERRQTNLQNSTGQISQPAERQLHQARPSHSDAGTGSDCDQCNGIGFYRVNVPVGHELFGKAIPCDCMKKARQKRAQAALWDNAGVPKRYAGYTFVRYMEMAGQDPGKQDAIAAIYSYSEDGCLPNPTEPARPYTGIMLHGASGVGKTGALSPLFTASLQAGKQGLWLQYNDFLDSVRRFDVEGGAQLIENRIRHAQSVPLLFIDDLGDPDSKRGASDYANDVLLRVVNHRVDNDLPMLITSNLDPANMAGQFRSRLYRRISECCAVIEVTGAPILALAAAQPA